MPLNKSQIQIKRIYLEKFCETLFTFCGLSTRARYPKQNQNKSTSLFCNNAPTQFLGSRGVFVNNVKDFITDLFCPNALGLKGSAPVKKDLEKAFSTVPASASGVF